MPHYENLSIFRTIDVADTAQMSRVTLKIKQILKDTHDASASVLLQQLGGNPARVVSRIVTAIKLNPEYPLLQNLMEWLVDPSTKLSESQRVREIVDIIEEDVFMNPAFHPEQYAKAESDFQKLSKKPTSLETDKEREIPDSDAQTSSSSEDEEDTHENSASQKSTNSSISHVKESSEETTRHKTDVDGMGGADANSGKRQEHATTRTQEEERKKKTATRKAKQPERKPGKSKATLKEIAPAVLEVYKATISRKKVKPATNTVPKKPPHTRSKAAPKKDSKDGTTPAINEKKEIVKIPKTVEGRELECVVEKKPAKEKTSSQAAGRARGLAEEGVKAEIKKASVGSIPRATRSQQPAAKSKIVILKVDVNKLAELKEHKPPQKSTSAIRTRTKVKLEEDKTIVLPETLHPSKKRKFVNIGAEDDRMQDGRRLLRPRN
ncbi:hypothetical protein PVAG01_02799 [Phlyctema vagabunda]|uniref:Uncharacterized protein n=1 Tax=Phlyctema vagabunda TaxID=108571 RepID=A0ABR4PS44_9HELO